MVTATEYQAKVNKSVTNLGRLDQFVNAGADADIVTDNGTVPSLAKLASQFSGWSPILSVVNDGSRRVLQIVDWTIASGIGNETKPDVGGYIGITGIVDEIADAVDIRGPVGPAGPISAADNVATSLAAIKAAPTTHTALYYDGAWFVWTLGNYSATPSEHLDNIIIKADSTDLSVGAWVRQKAAGVTFSQPGTAALRSAEDKARESVSVTDYWFAIDADDTLSFERAQATGKRVFVPANGGHGVGGFYMAHEINVVSGAYFYGEGENTVIQLPDGAYSNIFYANSGGAALFVENVTIKDMTLRGRVESTGFAEHDHIARLSGMRDLIVERVRFIGFAGDGLYIGSGDGATDERHNYNVTVRDCYFDGVNNDNRNAISVLDVVGMTIDNCDFWRCTRSNMPGPIDFEPNSNAFHVLRGITISNNRFHDFGGNLGAISFTIPTVCPLPEDINITNNNFYGGESITSDIVIVVYRNTTDSDVDMGVFIEGNKGRDGGRPFAIFSGKGVTFGRGNSWSDYANAGIIGFTDSGVFQIPRDLRLSGKFTNVGNAESTGGSGFGVYNVSNLLIDGLVLDRCGPVAAASYPFQFRQGSSDRVAIRSLKIVKRTDLPGGASQTVGINNAGHTFSSATNVLFDLQSDLTSQFASQSERKSAGSVITFENGWSNAGKTTIWRNAEGRVFLRLNLSGGTLTSGTRIGVMPTGYRPDDQTFVIVSSGTAFGVLRFDTDGSIFITPSAMPAASVNGTLTFSTGT